MGVLNFAHGAFLTVGAYALWFTESKLGGVPVAAAVPARRVVGLAVGAAVRRARRARADPAALQRHIEQVLVTVGLALALTALVTAIWGNDARAVAVPRVDSVTRRRCSAPTSRTTAGSRSSTAVVVLVGLEAFLRAHALRADHPRRRREPRDGDGARDRRPPRLHARLRDRGRRRRARRVLSDVYFSTVDPQQGTSLADLRLHRRRDRRARLARGARRSPRSSSGSCSSTRTTTPRRGSATSASCCCSASSCSPARAGSRGASHEAAGAVPVVVLVVLAFVPKLASTLPYVFQGAVNTPGTLQLLALCLVFGGLALTYDLLFGFTGLLSFGHALYFAVGVYVVAIAITQWHWSFWRGDRLHGGRRARAAARARRGLALRVGGIAFAMVTLAFAQAGSILVLQEPAQLDRRRGGTRGRLHRSCPRAFVGIFNTKNLYWVALAYAAVGVRGRPVGGRLVARARLAGDPRERAPRRGARAAPVRLQADVVRPRVVSRDRRRRRLPAADRRRDDRRDHARTSRSTLLSWS